ncbi:MAG: DNA internalization-related competence protein ComEC/Rec2 [bacterium]
MKDYPTIKLTILFIVGIVLQKIVQLNFLLLLISFAVLLVFLIISSLIKNQKLLSIRQAFLVLAIVIFGQTYYSAFHLDEPQYPFSVAKIRDVQVTGIINDISLLKDDRFRIEIETAQITGTGIERLAKPINIICTVYDDTTNFMRGIYSELSIGNTVKISGDIQKAREKRNPGEFDYYKYLLTQNISAVLNVYQSENIVITNNETSLVKNSFFEIRKAIDKQIARLHDREAAALLRGLFLADRSQIEYDLVESFINAGVVHVLAVSGLNVVYVVMVFLFIFGRFNIKLKTILSIIAIIFYLIITTGPASVFRACVMAIVLMLSQLTNRSFNINNSMAIAALVLLFINPDDLFNPGFQLSFTAVLAIVFLYPKFKNFIDGFDIKYKLIKSFLLFLSVSIAAQIGTLPFTLLYFNKLSVVALFANIIVIPATGILNASAILTIILGSIFTWAGQVFGAANSIITEWTFAFVRFAGKLDFSYLRINQFSLFDSIIFYMAVFGCIYLMKKMWYRRNKIIASALIFGTAFFIMLLDNSQLLPEGKLSVFTVDVGQGDAIIIKFPDGQTALIDAGNRTPYFDNGERLLKPLLERLGISQIDYGFVSHIDADHYGGFISLVQSGLVKRIYKPSPDTSSKKDVAFQKLLDDNHVPFDYYSKKRIHISNCNLYFLNDTSAQSNYIFDSNNRSGVIKLVHGNNSFLFTGDLGIEGEELIVEQFDEFVKSDYIKIGHHGSKSSSSDLFLDAVNPDIGIISAGLFNNYKHPSPKVMTRLRNKNIAVSRTDFEGGILFISDGEKIEKINWKDSEINLLTN